MRGRCAGGQDGFAVADVPAGIGIAEQLLVALEEEQAVEQRDAGRYQGQVRRKPGASGPASRTWTSGLSRWACRCWTGRP